MFTNTKKKTTAALAGVTIYKAIKIPGLTGLGRENNKAAAAVAIKNLVFKGLDWKEVL